MAPIPVLPAWIRALAVAITLALVGNSAPQAAADAPDASDVERLVRAIRADDAAAVRECIAAGITPDDIDGKGSTPLHLASRLGVERAVEALADTPKWLASRASGYADCTPLHFAAGAFGRGHAKVLSILLARGAEVDARSSRLATPLMLAAEVGEPDCVRILLDAGAAQAAVDDKGWTALHFAISSANSEKTVPPRPGGASAEPGGSVPAPGPLDRGTVCSGLLLRAGADPNHGILDVGEPIRGQTPLHWAARSCRLELVRLLLDHGAAPSARDSRGGTPLHYAAGCEREQAPRGDVMKLLAERGGVAGPTDVLGSTPLHIAALAGNVPAVEALLASGAEIEARVAGRTPLFLAAQGGRESVVSLLLDRGAEVDGGFPGSAVGSPLFAAIEAKSAGVVRILVAAGAALDRAEIVYGNFPLHYAARQGNPRIVQELLAAGAPVDSRGVEGATPLHLAAAESSAAVVEVLLAHGADPEIADRASASRPIHWTGSTGSVPVLELLLRAGIAVDALDASGQTALLLATQGGHEEFVRRLERAGADPRAKTPDGFGALHVAATSGRVELLRHFAVDLSLSPDEPAAGPVPWRPLHCACRQGKSAAVAYLLGIGADPRPDATGVSALELARESGDAETLRLIESALGR